MRHFTEETKRRGELAIRRLSDRAQGFYYDSEIVVCEYDTEEGTRYAYDYGDVGRRVGFTIDQLQDILESYATLDLWSFQQLPIADQIAYIESLDRWDDVDAEYYETLCEDLGLDYSAYDDPDILWRDIKEAADEQ